MRIAKFIGIVIVSAAITHVTAACVTPYGREGYFGGYTDRPLGNGQFLITYSGNGYTSAREVRSRAHQRATEVCRENGFTAYDVLDKDHDVDTAAYARCNGQGQSTDCSAHTVDKHSVTLTIRCRDPQQNP